MEFSKLIYLLEKSKQTSSLLPDSDSARKERADHVKILSIKKYTPSTSPPNKPLLPGWKLWTIETVSREKTEGRTHSQYVVLDKNNNIKDIYCSCADFQFLWRYALNKGDMASWETYPEYKNIETHGPHTEEPSNITNPNFNKKLCKHLIKIFDILDI
jgi:hypothetical protein